MARIDTRVDEIALAQLSEVEVNGEPMRAQKLAELVVSGDSDHAWFDDAVTLAPEHAPPFAEAEAGRLREARRKLGRDLTYVNARTTAADSLLTPEQVGQLHEVLVRMRDIEDQVGQGALLPLKAFTPEVLDGARKLLAEIETAMRLLGEIDELSEGWAHQLRLKCRTPTLVAERAALEALFGEIAALIEARAVFLQRPVEMPEDCLRSAKARQAIERGALSGKPFGLMDFGVSDAKELLGRVKVAGLPPQSQEDWNHVSKFVSLQTRIVSFVTRWNEFAPSMLAPRLDATVSALRRIETVTTAARRAHRVAKHYDVILVKLADAVFQQPPVKHLNGTAAELAQVREHLRAHLTKAELARAAVQLSTLQEKLAGTTGPVSEALAVFVEKELGKQGLPAERAAADYARLLAELRRIQGLAIDLDTVREAAARVEAAGAPKLAARIRSVPIGTTGEDNTFPAMWRSAWTWARVKSHLEQIEARDELLTLSARRRDLEQGLAKLYRDMVAKAAWLSTKLNATPRVLQALQGYATAIHKIGKGTGQNAIRLRRDARAHMLDAVGAVPCWIMSHAKVSESVPAELGKFDLIIVDEASQSTIWALPAVMRGKKVLVVGDDKQVSPDVGFVSAARTQELRDRFLTDQPYKEALAPGMSLYDLASRVFAAHQVMLREHFRCVPPIIAYSNRVFYKGGIRPLRIPTASERIDPPLVDVYLATGVRSGKTNHDEAVYIANEIAALLGDERFIGRTIGAISLLGIEQAKLIDSEVRRRCDAAELYRRKFETGLAATFQGSERDIMFLSLVAAPGNCTALSGNAYDQRFNVAASRARDRMYLVRSVSMANLSEVDLRRTLLSHFETPVVADKEAAEVLIDRCESGFEREVFSALTERGYKVTPQVETGAFRIDMVVESATDVRLAIECDGDEFHGPDRWEADMTRQRVLERAGWTFWRCFASTWKQRRDEVLGELIQRLTAMGIEPVGSEARAPLLVERRVIEGKTRFSETAELDL